MSVQMIEDNPIRFDLPEVVTSIRDDIEDAVANEELPDAKYTVRLVRRKRTNNAIVISGVPEGFDRVVYEMARMYVWPDWDTYKQQWGLNFVPVIKLS